MRSFPRPDDPRTTLGQEIGLSDWIEIDQPMIDAFAETTADHQWIHVDVQRAAESPAGTTIAHGYLTLSPLPHGGRRCRGAARRRHSPRQRRRQSPRSRRPRRHDQPRYLWGLAANGQAGVENVLDILRSGIDSALSGLCRSSVCDLTRTDVLMPEGFTRAFGAGQ